VWEPSTFGYAVLSTVVFGLLGIVMTIIGFKLFDAFVSFNLAQEICEKQNIAVAILCAAMVLGISIIVAVAII
jgi:putative membrane protein